MTRGFNLVILLFFPTKKAGLLHCIKNGPKYDIVEIILQSQQIIFSSDMSKKLDCPGQKVLSGLYLILHLCVYD